MSQNDGVCEACGGVGYKVTVVDGIGYAGQCECFGERVRASQARAADVPDKYSRTTFESFSTQYAANPVAGRILSGAVQVARRWARQFFPIPFEREPRPSGLLFTGDTGCGKTHLAVSALKMVLEKGCTGVFRDYRTLLSQVARGWSADAGSDDKRAFRVAVESDVLLIDDLGAQRNMEWAEDIITEIINERYNANKAVIVTTNLAMFPRVYNEPSGSGFGRQAKTLGEVIGERAKSRLMEMCTILDLSGVADYRERHAKQPTLG
jgi:DNA replication protein DnaC